MAILAKRLAATRVRQGEQGGTRGKPFRAAATEPQDKVERALSWMMENPPKPGGKPMLYVPEPKEEIPEVIDSVQPEDIGQGDFAEVAASVLYLAGGALDKAHNIVTPLSWPSATPFGGPPRDNGPAKKEAAYVHSLIHRAEGEYLGEFGAGYQNSGFWLGQAKGTLAIHSDLLEEARRMAQGDPELEQHVQSHGAQWNPRTFLDFCRKAERSGDQNKIDFCSKVMTEELRLIFEHCRAKANQPA